MSFSTVKSEQQGLCAHAGNRGLNPVMFHIFVINGSDGSIASTDTQRSSSVHFTDA